MAFSSRPNDPDVAESRIPNPGPRPGPFRVSSASSRRLGRLGRLARIRNGGEWKVNGERDERRGRSRGEMRGDGS